MQIREAGKAAVEKFLMELHNEEAEKEFRNALAETKKKTVPRSYANRSVIVLDDTSVMGTPTPKEKNLKKRVSSIFVYIHCISGLDVKVLSSGT